VISVNDLEEVNYSNFDISLKISSNPAVFQINSRPSLSLMARRSGITGRLNTEQSDHQVQLTHWYYAASWDNDECVIYCDYVQ